MTKVMLVRNTSRPLRCPLAKGVPGSVDEFEIIIACYWADREMLDRAHISLMWSLIMTSISWKQGQDLTDVTIRVLTGLRDVFKECRPDIVLVHGDTNTLPQGSPVAFYAQIPVVT